MEPIDGGEKEKLRVAIKERVAKEERAYRLVEKMVLISHVDKDFLLNAGKYITISQYKDITEERAITKYCGYPLCDNRIAQVLKQKYSICLREKKVFDITERKNFCGNFCFKASKYFESQLSSEPVWMREMRKFPDLLLLGDSKRLQTTISGLGSEIFIKDGVNIAHTTNREVVEDDDLRKTENYSKQEKEKDQNKDNTEHVDNKNKNRNDYDKIHSNIHFDNSELGCIMEKMQVQIDLDFDLSDSDDVIDITDIVRLDHFRNNTDDEKTNEAIVTIDCISNDKPFQSENTILSKEKYEEPIEIHLKKLQNILAEWCSIKTKDYLRHSLKIKQNLHELEKFDESFKDEERGSDAVAVIIPSIDWKSQMEIRGKIVLDKITKAISPMLSELRLTHADVSSQLAGLLKTFRFTSKNIVLKPKEWTLVALILLFVLIKFDKSLQDILLDHQAILYSLISRTIGDGRSLECFMDVFNVDKDDIYATKQEGFDMEELD